MPTRPTGSAGYAEISLKQTGSEVPDRSLAGTVPQSIPRLPNEADNLGTTVATVAVLIAVLDFSGF